MRCTKKFRLGYFLCILASLMLFGVTPIFPQTQKSGSHEQVKINILASASGAGAYVMSFALADIINKNHPWLRAEAVESPGAEVNYKNLALKPELRANTIVFITWMHPPLYNDLKKKDDPDYTTCRFITRIGGGAVFFIARDPNIKKPHELVGKSIHLLARTSSMTILAKSYLETWGILDKVKLLYGAGFKSGHDALMDGLADACLTYVNPVTYAPIPILRQAAATRDVYGIGPNEDDGEAVSRRWSVGYTKVPSRILGDHQTDPIGANVTEMGWWADVTMDDSIVYDVIKTAYENIEKFGDYHVLGKTLDRKTIGSLMPRPKESYHPGALKFFGDFGIKKKFR